MSLCPCASTCVVSGGASLPRLRCLCAADRSCLRPGDGQAGRGRSVGGWRPGVARAKLAGGKRAACKAEAGDSPCAPRPRLRASQQRLGGLRHLLPPRLEQAARQDAQQLGQAAPLLPHRAAPLDSGGGGVRLECYSAVLPTAALPRWWPLCPAALGAAACARAGAREKRELLAGTALEAARRCCCCWSARRCWRRSRGNRAVVAAHSLHIRAERCHLLSPPAARSDGSSPAATLLPLLLHAAHWR